MALRIIFLGTPDFAAIPLLKLAKTSGHQLVGIVTQPDRPQRRSATPEPPGVKRIALAEGLDVPIFQPETLKDPAAIAQLVELQPDIGVVASYGELLRKQVLAIPRLGYLNIHPSLLPRYRGPTPVHSAILAGDQETGVTVMKLEAKMDSGPILAQQRYRLAPEDRTSTLTNTLFELGSDLLLQVLNPYAEGTLVPQPQDDAQATYCKLLTRADGEIDWHAAATQIERMTRAYDPWPGTFTTFRGQPFKIIQARVRTGSWNAAVGALVDDNGLLAVCGTDALELLQVQPAGKRPLAASDWRRGLRNLDDARLG